MPNDGDKEGLSKINRKRFELDPIEAASYHPVKSPEVLDQERAIADDLVDNGVEQEIASAVIGYAPEDIPFVYRTDPIEITDGSTGNKIFRHLWIGASDAIHNLSADWPDQILEVLVQWQGSQDISTDHTEVERLEAHHLKDGSGRFVSVVYRGVSDMGQFDGEIASMELYVPEEKFRPGGGPKERQSYRIYPFSKNDTGRWNIDLAESHLSGTTILNGLQQIINFRLAGTRAIKADAPNAYRLSLSPQDVIPALPATVEEEFHAVLAQTPGKKAEMVESLYAKALSLMEMVAPMVLSALQVNDYSFDDIVSMAADGIINHPEKIPILEHRLSDLDREKRFLLAQFTTALIREGKFTEWIKTLSEPINKSLVNDTVKRNTFHILDWLLRTAPADVNLSQWLDDARKTDAEEFTQCFEGMVTSFVERYIEYLAQQFFGRSLQA